MCALQLCDPGPVRPTCRHDAEHGNMWLWSNVRLHADCSWLWEEGYGGGWQQKHSTGGTHARHPLLCACSPFSLVLKVLRAQRSCRASRRWNQASADTTPLLRATSAAPVRLLLESSLPVACASDLWTTHTCTADRSAHRHKGASHPHRALASRSLLCPLPLLQPWSRPLNHPGAQQANSRTTAWRHVS